MRAEMITYYHYCTLGTLGSRLHISSAWQGAIDVLGQEIILLPFLFSLFKSPLLLFEFLLHSIHTHARTHTHTCKHIHTLYTTHTHTTHKHAIRRSNRPWTHHFLSRTPHSQLLLIFVCFRPYPSLHLFLFYSSFWSPRHLPHCLPPAPPLPRA